MQPEIGGIGIDGRGAVVKSWPGSEHRQHLMLIITRSVSSGFAGIQDQVAQKYGLLTLQEAQEQLEQLPEQQLQEQGDILAELV